MTRASWASLPHDLAAAVEARLGAPVARAADQTGGFSPGVAARLTLTDGRRAFVKAVSPTQNPDSPHIHRAEARIAADLPRDIPAPRLLDSFEQDGWVVLAFEDVPGRHPTDPWDAEELRRVMDALDGLAGRLTPSPVAAPPAAERLAGSFGCWAELAADRDAGTDDLGGLDPWAAAHLDDLAALESGWPQAVAGDTLAHGDLRADNILLTTDGRVVFVDWPWACTSTPWFDLLCMLPSIVMQGGPEPEGLFAAHPPARDAHPEAVDAALAALTGMFLVHARRPAPPGLPTLRAFQRAQGAAALSWLRTRLRPTLHA
ncbi:aminoglycoside phosphotransferase family protein [Actinacidiphila glaucinigra]|uniref:Phosphotransferase enzyme family protein n=1 Tax=Actinacidiphila glaucinigra TaxID=235986 RepID=A0A239NQ50_9ACTN|nr:aminoglycoside phosphotransferase family protein [Actinacidiphila glaucinigra]SNT56504.1 Phosphotransferase enzyme family protein [Actinacidiphila glaucinigra]